MVSLAQKCFAGCLGGEHAGLTFDAEVVVEAAMPRNEANDGLGEMDVEVVANDIPPCVGGGAAQQGVEKTSKVLLGPGVADHPGDFADRDIETGDQGLSAVAAILDVRLAPQTGDMLLLTVGSLQGGAHEPLHWTAGIHRRWRGGVAARRTRAAAGPDAANRRADGPQRGRSCGTGSTCCVPPRFAGSRLVCRPQCADRYALGSR